MSGKTTNTFPGFTPIFLAGMLIGVAEGLALSAVWHPVPFISGPGITATALLVVAIVLLVVATVRARRAGR